MATRRSDSPVREPRPLLRKALGQHHLTSPELCRPAVEFLRTDRGAGGGRRVLEIGPGGGVLTRVLVAEGWRVLAVELDRAWAFELRRRLAGLATGRDRLQVVVGDALELSYSGLPAGSAIAGNLPYGISTAIVERVLDDAPCQTRCAFLVQREVADRLLAAPGSRTYGSLSVLVAMRARGRLLARVRPGSFHPPPKVESAFVGLEIQRSELEPESWSAFKHTVRTAFGQRRKTIANSLAAGFGPLLVRRALERCGLDPRLRAEALRLEDFAALHRALGVGS